jgi:hypothetical protein
MGESPVVSSGAEQRRASRASVRCGASYRLLHDQGAGDAATRSVDSEAVNVSLLGAMIQTDELEVEGVSLLPAMEPDPLTRIDVHFDLDGSQGVDATGRVVWVRRSAAGARRKYTVGVVFSYLSPKSQAALRSFLDSRPAS